jgi:hypothetical protein
MDFVDIDLQENDVTDVMLPSIRENRAQDLVAALIWRIVVKNQEEYEVFYLYYGVNGGEIRAIYLEIGK